MGNILTRNANLAEYTDSHRVTVGAFEDNVYDDSNSLHLLCNCRTTVSIVEPPFTRSPFVIVILAEVRLGAFGGSLPVGMLSRKIF